LVRILRWIAQTVPQERCHQIGEAIVSARLSVIIPTRNCLEYLPFSIESALSLGIDGLEILVVDDGSTDGTGDWLSQFAAKNREIIAIEGHGFGPSAARNRAIARASAPLVAFLDADDSWLPGAVADRLAFHEANPDVLLSFADYRHVAMDGTDLGGCFAYWPRFAKRAGMSGEIALVDRPLSTLFAENVVGTSTVIARRTALEQLGGFNDTLKSAEDWEMWLRLSMYGKVAFHNAIEAEYLVRPNSVSRSRDRRIEAMYAIYEQFADAAAAEDRRMLAPALARIAEAEGEVAHETGRYLKAASRDLAAWLLAPTRRRLVSVARDLFCLATMMPAKRA
jgi:glycosyltransferase involved in cell wall biosynthesis